MVIDLTIYLAITFDGGTFADLGTLEFLKILCIDKRKYNANINNNEG